LILLTLGKNRRQAKGKITVYIKMGKKQVILKKNTDPSPFHFHTDQISTIQDNPSVNLKAIFKISGNCGEQCRFTAATRTHDGRYLPFGDSQSYRPEQFLLAVAHLDFFEF
jgi:hypothetical protein